MTDSSKDSEKINTFDKTQLLHDKNTQQTRNKNISSTT